MPTKNAPKHSAASTASAAPGTMPPARRDAPDSGSAQARAAPMSTRPMPTAAAVAGRSPVTTAAVMGTSAAADEIGATIDIGPTARPL